MDLDYTPPLTVGRFLHDDKHLVRVLVGPVGSGKSMGAIMEIMRRSAQQAPHSGIRYTRWALIRNTLQQLKQTVLSDILQYLGPAVHYLTYQTERIFIPIGCYFRWTLKKTFESYYPCSSREHGSTSSARSR